VLGDEDVAAVLGREHLARVEAHAERRHVRAEDLRRPRELVARAARPELGVERVALVAVREAEVHPGLRRVVELVARHGRRRARRARCR
jgi:hypothetical protein